MASTKPSLLYSIKSHVVYSNYLTTWQAKRDNDNNDNAIVTINWNDIIKLEILGV